MPEIYTAGHLSTQSGINTALQMVIETVTGMIFDTLRSIWEISGLALGKAAQYQDVNYSPNITFCAPSTLLVELDE